MKIIIVLIIGVALFIMLRVLGILKKHLVLKYSGWTRKFNVLPAIELITWMLYIFWVSDFLFKDKFYYPYIVISLVIIIVALFAWFLAKDFFAGIIFRIQNDVLANNNIQLGSISGRVKSQHITYLTIETSNNQLVRIPYSKLQQEITSKFSEAQETDEYRFVLVVNKGLDKSEIEEKIRILIINSPWCNFRERPKIKLITEDKKTFSFEIRVNTLSQKHLQLLEKAINEQVAKF